MKFAYYADCITGEVVHCEILPDSWDKKCIEDKLRKFNARENKTTNAYVSEAEDGSLTAYLIREAKARQDYPREVVNLALGSLENAKAAIESLLVERMK